MESALYIARKIHEPTETLLIQRGDLKYQLLMVNVLAE